jgi:tetratricopeptide (TPR) repeat protein
LAAFLLSTRIIYGIDYLTHLPFAWAPVVDAEVYDLWAGEIAGGNWIGEGVFYRAPLYPYALALFYSAAGRETGRLAALAIQALAGVVGLLLLHRLGERWFGRGAALATTALAALYAPIVFFESKLLPTSLSLFLQIVTLAALAGAWRTARPVHLLAAGVAGGIYALARPSALIFILVAVAWRIATLKRGPGNPSPMRWALVPLGTLLAIAPVAVRNYGVAGDLVAISANGGITFYHGNNEENASGLMSVPSRLHSIASARHQEALEAQVAARETGREMKPSERSRYWFDQGLAFWAHRPGQALLLMGKKLIWALGSYEFSDNYSLPIERERLASLRVFAVPFTLLLVLGALGFAWMPPREGARPLLSAAFATGLMTNLVFFVSSRYRLETIPALALLAGWGATEGWRRARARATGWKVPLLAGALLLPAFVPAPRGRASQESIMWMQLGGIHRDRAQWHEAEEAFARAVAEHPGNPFAMEADALALLALGRPDDAERVLSPALAAGAPPHPGVLHAAAAVREASGDLRGAEAALREALRRAPSFGEAHRRLGRLYLRQGETEEAATHLARARDLGLALSEEEKALLESLTPPGPRDGP